MKGSAVAKKHIKPRYKLEDLYSQNVLHLPRLPIPPIEKTLQSYENSIYPLKPLEECKAHLDLLNKFRDGSARRLNDLLIENDKQTALKSGYPFNYVEEQWDKNFLAFRGSSPINISPAVSLKPVSRTKISQCSIAAEYVHACVRWYSKLRSGNLDMIGFQKKQKMDFSQLPTQFGCCRLSYGEIDTKMVTLSPKHIIVLYKAHVFEVAILDKDGRAMSVNAIQRALSNIVSSTTEENPQPIGILSTGGRNDLVEYTHEIESVGDNGELLESVNSAFLTVCLDSYPASDNDVKLQAALHGVGRDRNNRWFDKNQLIISKDGYVAMNFEHAFSDKTTWTRWLDEVWNDINNSSQNTPYSGLPKLEPSRKSTAPFRKLVFEIPSSMHGIINSAKQGWRNATKDLYQGTLVSDFGLQRLKKYKIDPDAFMQMSLHLAFYRLSGRMAPTYRSASTASFFHGRTETVRSATSEMLAIVSQKGLTDPTALSRSKLRELRNLAEAAGRKHANLSQEASQGMGIDRHLLALNALAAADDTSAFSDATEFFDSPMYTYSGNWQMYTTNATYPFFDQYCTGPVMEHGYGLGYTLHEEHVKCSVSSFLSSRKADGPAMRDGILQAMRDIAVLFEGCENSRNISK
ncbi:carnitine/choline acetyltransferase [Perkinsela sp. CCAP 1560/4]|nr:carnitine/choline acetyltransferase [Perkinsela sp. CCAP 1560/4]|eukprot:KNH07618.1 carnitine/choline acetyltransferase [Perkinsela sp. CCAP 1560/4]